MKQTMEEGVSEVLSGVVQDVGLVVSGNSGAQILRELLSAPWLSALLKMYESLLQFQRLRPSPLLPYSAGLSNDIMCVMSKSQRPSAEARELFWLLCSPHMKEERFTSYYIPVLPGPNCPEILSVFKHCSIKSHGPALELPCTIKTLQALLWSHDTVAQQDFGPVLEPLPDDLSDDEEAVRIVCLVKNNQPLWESLHREPAKRRAWSGEELATPESVARLLPFHHSDATEPFLPRYQSTGSCCVCPRAQKTGLNQSAPTVCYPYRERCKRSDSTDEYSFLPPPVPVCSVSLPSSPALCKKTSTYAPQYLTSPTPSSNSKSLPSSPAMRRSTPPQGGSARPTRLGSFPRHREERQHLYCNFSQVQTMQINQQRPVLRKQRSIDELRSVVQNVASAFSNEDVHHLGHKMAAATVLMTDSVEENAQALNLLVEVVDKLQGLIVASKSQTSSPQNRPKQKHRTPPPQPPRRVSSLSPKIVRKAPTPYPRPLSTSSSSSSCSASSTSLHFCPDAYKPSRRDPRKSVTFGGRSNGQVRLNNGSVSRAPSSDQYDCDTSCLTTKKKKKK